MSKDLKEIKSFLLDQTKSASRIALGYYQQTGSKFETKDDGSPVTKADIEINQSFIDGAKKNFPDVGVLGEELSRHVEGREVFVIDPIDGTMPFTRGWPVFGFMAAYVADGQPLASVVHNIALGRTLCAVKGRGTFLQETDEQVFVSNKELLTDAVIDVGWDLSDQKIANKLHELESKTSCTYSQAEISSMVSVGAFDGGVYINSNPHDAAAPMLIVEEAGGKVTDLDGNSQRYDRKINGAVYSNSLLHDKLLEAIRSTR